MSFLTAVLFRTMDYITAQTTGDAEMSRPKKILNKSGIPQHAIDRIAQCVYPDILAFYESEEGQRAFAAWLAQQQKEKQQDKPT